MIGFYNYSVILTYISLLSSVFGMMLTMNGNFKLAIVFLAFSGLCDMFDGKIARAMKNRSDDAKRFGIQIDSLCDVVCFGVFPVLLTYRMGVNGIAGLVILAVYSVASVIRLAFFNVMEEKRQDETDENRKCYQGLPITSIAVALPITFACKQFLGSYFVIALHIVMLAVGILFITDFKFKKPNNAVLGGMVAVVALALLFMCRRMICRYFGLM